MESYRISGTRGNGPPPELVESLLAGPSIVTGFEWHEEIDSTMRRAAVLAREGRDEGVLVLADVQTAGKGRRGRTWVAPPGTSLLCSLLLRPVVDPGSLTLLPLLAGLAVAESAAAHAPGAGVALKWPNDVLVAGRKVAGVLAETGPGEAVVLGIGLNVDWRGVDRRGVGRPADLGQTTSLAEVAAAAVDRWRVLAGLVGVLGNRYDAWREHPEAFLDDYRARCDTLSKTVRVTLPGRDDPLEGLAERIGERGTLTVRDARGRRHEVSAGDVEHVRS